MWDTITASTNSILQTPSSAFASVPITEDYKVGINQIDLGPRVNDYTNTNIFIPIIKHFDHADLSMLG